MFKYKVGYCFVTDTFPDISLHAIPPPKKKTKTKTKKTLLDSLLVDVYLVVSLVVDVPLVTFHIGVLTNGVQCLIRRKQKPSKFE